MGWWRRDAGVIGDSVADYMDAIKEILGGIPWRSPSEMPAEVRERLASFYCDGLGRMPTDEDLAALLDFSRGEQ
jgi:hypothetical protein